MSLDAFKRTMSDGKPPARLRASLQALWWAAQAEWNRARELVQDDESRDAAWVHAYLHRVEGDLDNAGYWYRQAGQTVAAGPLDAEWDAIATALLASLDGSD